MAERLGLRFRYGSFAFAALPLLVAACSDEAGSNSADATEERRMRIVEVLSTPVDPAGAFIELRNDADADVSINGWALRFGTSEARLQPRKLEGAGRGAPAGTVPGHALALVVDSKLSDAEVERIACEAPIATKREGLGEVHAAADDMLVTTLELQKWRHCMPVFTVSDLAVRLGKVTEVSLVEKTQKRDRARAKFAASPKGVSYERNAAAPEGFVLSPIGASPGARNFWRSDPARLADADARAPISTMSSSPWRVGDAILALQRAAAQKSGAEAQALLDEAAAIAAGKLPHNPLIEPFDALVNEAERSAVGAFYQVNEPGVVDAYINAAKNNGTEVKLVTDAEFKTDTHYVGGFTKLGEAGVPLVFDEVNGKNRAPLMHDKFMVVDDRWVWTGSFNPIEDEPSRIHADNVVLLHSTALAQVHAREFDTLFGGSFGVMKRGKGLGGTGTHVDGARVDVRFSPGLTADQLKRRGAELLKTGDRRKACEVVAASKNVVEERYRNLDPCGGPYDLIVGEVARAKSSIYFVSFSLALKDLAHVMIERLQGGVDVRGVVDPTVVSRGAPSMISAAGGDVRFTPNSNPACPEYVKPKTKCPSNPNKVWLHHKFVLVDYGTEHAAVITGSHNMSDSAELQNDEGLVVIRDRAVVEAYYRIFREAFNHPQALGGKRDESGLPALAITEVKPSTDPADVSFVEVQNLGDEPADLGGLSLWNRRGAPVALGAAKVQPGQRAIIAVGTAPSAPAGVPVVVLGQQGSRPFVDPTTALVLHAADGRWITTYDPYTSEQTLPEGVDATAAAASKECPALNGDALDAWTVELLGHNDTPDAEIPTWNPRGLYSDWLDDHDVNPTGLILMKGVSEAWTPAAAATGTPGS